MKIEIETPKFLAVLNALIVAAEIYEIDSGRVHCADIRKSLQRRATWTRQIATELESAATDKESS